jgi:hypothetical protein
VNFFSSILKDIEAVPGEIEGLFSTHQTQIHTAIADAQTALSVGATIASVAGAAGVATEMGKVSGALTTVSAAAGTLGTAASLNAQIATLAGATNSLIASGDIGVKNATSQASLTNTVNAVVGKVNTVIGALAVASTAAGS